MRRHFPAGAAALFALTLFAAGCAGSGAGSETPARTEAPSEADVPADTETAEAMEKAETVEEEETEPGAAAGGEAEVPDTAAESEETGPTANSEAAEPDADEAFYMTEISDALFARMEGKTFKADCTLPREDLRYLHVLHVDGAGEVHEGEMVVNYHIAEDVLEILRKLYEAGYPIERMRLMDEYDADDETAMRDNNSSCFNFRFISHTTRVSKHGLGLAVDINTLYNPYTRMADGVRIVEPATGEAYLDREADFPYKITEGDLCWQLFAEHGFIWGGSWKNRKDYQHFEVPTDVIRQWYPGY